MSRFPATTPLITSGRLISAALAATLVSPITATAFYQSTKLEGAIGTDIGGVWLSIQSVMPEFRITYPKPTNGPALPIEVGPIPADLEDVAGKIGGGVVISRCLDPTFCSTNGLLVGDILIKVNSEDLGRVEDFQRVQASDLPPTVMLSVRRPALKMTSARLIKIRYKAEGKEVKGVSVAQETVDIRVLDTAFPFADDIEKARQAHTTFKPTAAQIEAVAGKWFELPSNEPPILMSASHRFVARDNFDESLSADHSLTNAKDALVMDMEGNPLQGGGAKIVDVYGIESLDPKSMEGNYVTVTIASAPFPINIEFKGRFHMTRVADWSDQDDKLKAAFDAARKPAEDLSKYKTLPDVPAAKLAPKAAAKKK